MSLEDLGLSPELTAKAKACTSPEELEDLVGEADTKLSLDDLDGAAGGCSYCGDAREDVDPAHIHADFMNGVIDGGTFF